VTQSADSSVQRVIFRVPTTGLLPVGLLAICETPVVTTAGPAFAVLYLVPILLAVWILRTRTVVDTEQLRTRSLFGARTLAWAEVLEAQDIFIGVNALDYSGYPDCRPEYIAAFQRMAGLATKAGVEGSGVRINAPLIRMTKADIIRKGTELGVDFDLTLSCYDPSPGGEPCGRCDACQLRAKGFAEASL